MDIRKLQRAIVDGLEDVKAQHIVVFNTEHLSPLFERVIVASGTSNRQTKALASSVRDTVKARGMPVLRTEGEDNGEWIIVDCGAAVCHIMQPAIRDYYHLEEIWGGKPVRLKLGGEERGLPKASEEPVATAAARGKAPTAVAAKGAAAKKAAGKGTPKGAATKAPAAKRTAAKKAAATDTAAKKAAVAPKAAKRVAVAADPSRSKAAPGKTAPRKTAAARTPGAKASGAKAPSAKTSGTAVRAGALADFRRKR